MTSAFRSKKDVVYDTIRANILNGEYEPGSRLIIDDLTAKLGVSQIPIREAMRQLESDGFVTIEPYVGATVTPIDADFIYEVFALLESTEVICGRAACQAMTDDDFMQLKTIIEAMDSSLKDPDKWSYQNAHLHLFICKCAGTELVMKMMKRVFDHWDRLRLHYLQNVSATRLEIAQKEHQQLLKVLMTRDPDAVEQVIREHNQNALVSYIQHLQSTGHLTNIEDIEEENL